MGIWTGVKNMIMKMLRINPAPENRVITITEPFSYATNVLRNRLWSATTMSDSRSATMAGSPECILRMERSSEGTAAQNRDLLTGSSAVCL